MSPIHHYNPARRGRAAAWVALLAGGLLAAFTGCMTSEKENPSGTEVENEVRGFLYLADGTPAAGAKVRLYPVGFGPRPGATETGAPKVATSDEKGAYIFDSLITGEYNLLGSKGGWASYLDSIVVGRSTRNLPADTLRDPGSLLGYVAVQPNHLPSTATVEILGTQFYTNVDETGKFRFTGLAGGRYSIRITTTLLQYTTLYSGFTVRANRTDTLADTLRIPFTGIPVVTGLHVEYDTLNGVAHLGWRAVKYPLLQDYAIFRDEAGSLDLSTAPLKRTRETSASDAIFPVPADQEAALAMEHMHSQLEYRIKARNKSDDPGANFGFLPLDAPSPAWVRTFLFLSAPDAQDATLSVNDSVIVLLDYRNETRKNDSLSWFLGSAKTADRARTGAGLAGSDSWRVGMPKTPGSFRVRVVARDAGGSHWERDIAFNVIEDRPSAHAYADESGRTGASMRLKGTADQRFGSISKWEWDVGGTGVFRSSGPDTLIKLPSAPVAHFLCILKVTDDDGNTGLDTAHVIVAHSTLFPAGATTASFAEAGGTVYFFGGEDVDGEGFRSDAAYAFDTSTHALRAIAPIPPPARKRSGALAHDGKIYLIGGTVINGFNGTAMKDVQVYDMKSNTWTLLRWPMDHALNQATGYMIGGKLVVLGEAENGIVIVQEYDFEKEDWSVKLSFPGPVPIGISEIGRISTTLLDGKIYVLGPGHFDIYDPVKNVVAAGPAFPVELPGSIAAAAGKIWVFGSTSGKAPTNRVHSFDPGTNAWTESYPMIRTRYMPQAVAFNGHILLFRGNCGWEEMPLTPPGNLCGDGEDYPVP